MKLRGGYNISLVGRPNDSIRTMPTPSELYMPLKSKRFNFTALSVKQGDSVKVGDVLAKDPDNYDIPMVCPVDATVQLETDYIKLINVVVSYCYPTAGNPAEHIPQAISAEDKATKLVNLGAWEFFHDAYSDDLPDPHAAPQAVIVSTISLEPFVARGDVQLKDELIHFTRGLEHLQSLIEYQQIYLVLPKIKSDFAELVRKQIRGYAWVNIVEVDLTYPYDNFNILARGLKLKSSDGPIWSLKTEGVLAIDDALTHSMPCIERVVSVAGPDLDISTHIRVTTGYPLEMIKSEFGSKSRSRQIDGGIMTGRAIDEKDLAIGCETRGITFLPELEKREFIGWMRPGFERHSYSACFGSALLRDFPERLTTAVRGEVRPCISCNFCEEVCPAGIMPHLIHKYLYKDLIEDADRARIDLCVQCGLCSFVCTSKLELKEEFAKAVVVIEQEKEEARQIAAEREKAEAEAAEKAATAQESAGQE
jgi:Na(+)-translocating NADH:ubiquinone oxidoreductase A subunit